MLRRTIFVRVPVPAVDRDEKNNSKAFCGNSFTSETHDFVGTVFTNDDRPEDRWYRVSDVQAYFISALNVVPAFLQAAENNNQKQWQELVRRYNTTLQGLSYQVRDLNVLPTTMFVNAETLQKHSEREFV